MNKSEKKLLSSFHGNILNINNSWWKILSRKKNRKNTFIVGQLMISVPTTSAAAESLRVKVFTKNRHFLISLQAVKMSRSTLDERALRLILTVWLRGSPPSVNLHV